MKFSKTASVITAAALIFNPAFGVTAAAANTAAAVEPVFDDFNELDVNGSVTVNLPDNSEAYIDITFISPENSFEYDYYKGTFNSSDSSSYRFDIEGYGCVKDEEGVVTDGREYTFSISASDTEIGYVSGVFSEPVIVPDIDENPDLFTNYVYNVSIVQEDTDEFYSSETTEKTENGTRVIETSLILYIPETAVKGDVNDDGVINAVDASAVLTEYALIATGGGPTFNQKKNIAADVNEDGVINAVDASKILTYYAVQATGGTPSWD